MYVLKDTVSFNQLNVAVHNRCSSSTGVNSVMCVLLATQQAHLQLPSQNTRRSKKFSPDGWDRQIHPSIPSHRPAPGALGEKQCKRELHSLEKGLPSAPGDLISAADVKFTPRCVYALSSNFIQTEV